MDFKFEPIPLVQQKKKYANFTVREIGGPAEIIKWREMQAAKESAYRMRLGDRDTRIANFETEIKQKLDAPKVSSANWMEKLAYAKSERERLAKAEEHVINHPPWKPIEEPKLTLFERFKGFWITLWKNANF